MTSGSGGTGGTGGSDGLTQTLQRLIRDVPDFPSIGVLFKDIVPLLGDAAGFAAVTDWFADCVRAADAEFVAGIEARGFVLGAPAAYAAGVGFVPIRKAGKLPGPTRQAAYALEYGEATLEVSAAAIPPGARVLIVDDVLASGGTLRAAVGLVADIGAQVVGAAVLLEIAALGGRELVEAAPRRVSVTALLS